MTDDKRVETLRTFLQHYFRGDIDGAAQLLDQNVSYRIPGRHQLSGKFHGVDEVVQHLTAFKQLTEGTTEIIRWEDWLVGLHHVAAVAVLRAQQPSVLVVGRGLFLAVIGESGQIQELEAFFSDERSMERFITSRGM